MQNGSDDADVAALLGVLILLRDYKLDASAIKVGRIELTLSPRSQLVDDVAEKRERHIPFDASGGRLKS